MRVRAILALAVASVWLVVVAPASSASAPVAYPPVQCPTLSVSTTSPLAGSSITVSGSNFVPGAAVRLELRTQVSVLANVTTNNDGSFSVSVRLPAGVSGDHDIVAVGGIGTGATGCPASVAIVIHDIAGASTSAPAGNGGGTAFTGIDILALIAVAAALLAAGVLLNRRGNSAKRAASRY